VQEQEHEHEHEHYGLLPADGVLELTDKLTGYMYEIEHGGFSDVMGQVLDDLLDQSGGMPDDLKDSGAFEQISRGQLAVTLAYNLGRLEGRSPQVVNALIEQALQSFGLLPVDESAEITDEDFGDPKVQVYPRMRRLRYQAPQILQVQRRDDSPDAGDTPEGPPPS
jgi:hypothetical protein